MRHKFTICVDIDGVIRDWTGSVKRVFLSNYPQYSSEDIPEHTEWEISRSYSMITKKKLHDLIFEIAVDDVYLNAKAYPGCAKAFDDLRIWCEYVGAKLCILTSQPSSEIGRKTINWLFDKFFTPESARSKTELHVVCGPKTVVEGDVLIDDGIHNLIAWQSVGRMSICLEQPWNHEWDGIKITHLKDALPLIKNTYAEIL